MIYSIWRRCLTRFTRKSAAKNRRGTRHLVSAWRPWLERLEDRIAPATDITVVLGMAGTGSLDHFLSATNGTITTADAPGDTAATLSSGALAEVGSGPVGSGTAISIAATTAITFNDVGVLNLLTATGVSVAFSTTSGPISFANVIDTLNTAGGGLSFSAGTNLTLCNLNTNGGNVSLTAGTAATGNLAFGNILTNGSGNITFQATGNITQTGSSTAASGEAISATAVDNIVVNSLRGSTVSLSSSTGSISSSGSNSVQASAELNLSASTGITLNTLAASLGATNSTFGGIAIVQAASPAQTLAITSSGTGVVNNAAFGTIDIINLGSGITIDAGATITTQNGSINLAALDFNIAGTINSGTAGTALANSTAGRQFDLGTNTAGEIGLTQAELNNVTAGVLRIGTNPGPGGPFGQSAGAITISAPITRTSSPLTLITLDGVTETGAGSLTVGDLCINSGTPVTLTNANNVGTLAGYGASFSFDNGTNLLTIGAVDGLTGISANNSDITLMADSLNIQQSLNPGSGTVVLEPFTTSDQINVGAASTAGVFGLTDTELGLIVSGTAQIGSTSGSADSGGILISRAVTRTPTAPNTARYQTLVLSNQGAITQTAPLSVANLVANGTSVTLTNAGNAVGTLTGFSNSDFSFFDATALTTDTVDANNTLTLTISGSITINQLIDSLYSFVNLTVTGLANEGTEGQIAGPALELLGAGPYMLTNAANDVTTLAANVTSAVSFTNSVGLTIGTVDLTSGVTSTGSSIAVATVAGDLTVTQNVTAATTVSLTAGSTVASPEHILQNQAIIDGTTGVMVTADRMVLEQLTAAPAISSTDIVALQPFSSGRAVDLNNTVGDPTGELALSQTELNGISASSVRVGDLVNTGSLTVQSAIVPAPDFTTLSLRSRRHHRVVKRHSRRRQPGGPGKHGSYPDPGRQRRHRFRSSDGNRRRVHHEQRCPDHRQRCSRARRHPGHNLRKHHHHGQRPHPQRPCKCRQRHCRHSAAHRQRHDLHWRAQRHDHAWHYRRGFRRHHRERRPHRQFGTDRRHQH